MATPTKKTPQEIARQLLDPQAYEEEQKQKATAQKSAAPKKKLEKTAQPKAKSYFDIKIECMLPGVLTYRVLAEDAVQALELIKNKAPSGVQHKLVGRKELMARVYGAGSSMLLHMKKLFGG